MTKNARSSISDLAIRQGATALLEATFAFLRRNEISREFVLKTARQYLGRREMRGDVRRYTRLVRAYEDMGIVMSTWFSLPKFLDSEGRPLALTCARGHRSIASLIRSSGVKTSASLALDLMRRSLSVRIDVNGNLIALKRVFVLPEFEIPRAALVIERYLDTLRKNSSAAHRNATTLLLERNCHVPKIDPKRVAPILRDIKGRGTAFMDSVDGDIEAHRLRRSSGKGVGELGVLVFAWTQPSKTRRSKSRTDS
jgi:hypothetical protein